MPTGPHLTCITKRNAGRTHGRLAEPKIHSIHASRAQERQCSQVLFAGARAALHQPLQGKWWRPQSDACTPAMQHVCLAQV